MPDRTEFAEFVADVEPSLRRALADGFGPDAGREATIDALAFAWANWDRVCAAADPTAYLTRVGETAAERHVGDLTGDVTAILPRSTTAFDAVVPPVSDEAAVARSNELAGGGVTTMVRPGGSRVPVAAMPVEARTSRTVAWIVAVVLVGIVALGGIALANRDKGDQLDTDPSLLPTLPTTVAPDTSLPATLPPTAPAPTTVVIATTVPAATTLPEITAAPSRPNGTTRSSTASTASTAGTTRTTRTTATATTTGTGGNGGTTRTTRTTRTTATQGTPTTGTIPRRTDPPATDPPTTASTGPTTEAPGSTDASPPASGAAAPSR